MLRIIYDMPAPNPAFALHPGDDTPPDDVRVRAPQTPLDAEVTVHMARMTGITGLESLVLEPPPAESAPLALSEGAHATLEGLIALANPEAVLGDDALLSDDTMDAFVRAHVMLGDAEAARALLGERRSAPQFALADAALSLAEGDVPRARDRIDAALQNSPTGLAEAYQDAVVSLAEGDVDSAISTLNTVAKSSQDHALSRYQLGRIFRSMGDLSRAGIMFEMADVLAPQFTGSITEYAQMMFEAGHVGDALSLLDKLAQRMPESVMPRITQARMLVEANAGSSALSMLEVLTRHLPENTELKLLQAKALMQAGQADQARAAFEQLALESPPEVRVPALKELARLAIIGEPRDAATATTLLERASTLAPDDAEVWTELAKLRYSAGDVASAEDALDQVRPSAAQAGATLNQLLSAAALAHANGSRGVLERLVADARTAARGTGVEAQLEDIVAGWL